MTDQTLPALLRHFANHLNELQRAGFMPESDLKFAYAGSKGDLEWHAIAYQLTRYYRCNLMCHACFASKVDDVLLYLNVSDSAPWLATSVATNDFLANCLANSGGVPSLCNIDGWSSDTLLWDVMHNLYLACANDACGSSFNLLATSGFYGNGSKADRCCNCYDSWREFQRIHQIPTHIQRFTPNLFNWETNEYPDLEVKAAHLKPLIQFFAHELHTASIGGNPETKMAAVMQHALATFCYTLDRSDWHLAEWEADHAVKYGLRYIRAYKVLIAMALRQGVCRWKSRPKLHYIHHSVLLIASSRLNPMWHTCFMDEDFMGKIVKLAGGCHRSTAAHRVLQRWLQLLGVRWTRIGAATRVSE